MSVIGRLNTHATHERPDPEGGSNTILSDKWISVKTSTSSDELIGPSSDQSEFKFSEDDDIKVGDFLFFDVDGTEKKHEVIGIPGKLSGKQPWKRGVLKAKDAKFGS